MNENSVNIHCRSYVTINYRYYTRQQMFPLLYRFLIPQAPWVKALQETQQEHLQLYVHVGCVVWQFLSEETAITGPKAARSLGERQLRNRLQRWPAFFVSPVRWHTGHFHWIRRLTRQSKFRFSPKGHLQGTALITMQMFGCTQVGDRS